MKVRFNWREGGASGGGQVAGEKLANEIQAGRVTVAHAARGAMGN